jgi:hypothetical protein
MLFLTLTLLVAMPQTDSKAKPPLDPQRIKCRTQVETGSLVRRTKTCRTVADWRRQDEEQRSNATRAVDQGAVSCGDCKGGGG